MKEERRHAQLTFPLSSLLFPLGIISRIHQPEPSRGDPMPNTRPLNVFISYASQDRAKVRELYNALKKETWLNPWFDQEELLPDMDWDLEIYRALRKADVILPCFSAESVAKEGYVQKEFKRALDYAEEKPDGTIYVIPLRLDNCTRRADLANGSGWIILTQALTRSC